MQSFNTNLAPGNKNIRSGPVYEHENFGHQQTQNSDNENNQYYQNPTKVEVYKV